MKGSSRAPLVLPASLPSSLLRPLSSLSSPDHRLASASHSRSSPLPAPFTFSSLPLPSPLFPPGTAPVLPLSARHALLDPLFLSAPLPSLDAALPLLSLPPSISAYTAEHAVRGRSQILGPSATSATSAAGWRGEYSVERVVSQLASVTDRASSHAPSALHAPGFLVSQHIAYLARTVHAPRPSLVAIAAPPLPSPSQRPSRHSRHASSLASHLLSPRRHSASPPFRRSAYSGGVTSPPFLVLSRLCPILCPLSALSHPLIPPCPIPSFRPIPSPHSALTYPLTSPCPIFSLRPVPSPLSALSHPLTPPCPIPSLRPAPSPHSALPHPLTILDEQGARLRQTAWTCVPPHLASAFITSKAQMSYIT
ncbi:unnamed protein product [Closterium sp. NIES-65]|nr:unnamed protein product [Closterium sp. NIES-65]